MTGSEGAAAAAIMSDGLSAGGCRPAVKNVIAVSPLLEPLALPAIVVSSSSSLAGRLRLPPHISSRRFGGDASIGARLSTVPSAGRSHARPLLAKPRSSNCAARTARALPDEAPSTTAIRRLPLRVAEATRLYPDAQMKPVLNPSAPGKRPISLLKFCVTLRPYRIDGMWTKYLYS